MGFNEHLIVRLKVFWNTQGLKSISVFKFFNLAIEVVLIFVQFKISSLWDRMSYEVAEKKFTK